MQARRLQTTTAILVLALALAHGAVAAAEATTVEPATAGPTLVRQVDAAVARGVDWLVAEQRADGTWLSPKYGSFKDPMAFTPLVAKILFFAPATPARTAARDKAVRYIAGRIKADGTIDEGSYGLSYPVYSSALAVVVLSLAGEEYSKPRDAWLTYLRRFQYTTVVRNVTESGPFMGGWSYAQSAGSANSPNQPEFAAPDLSSTIFAVGALRFAKVDSDDAALRGALAFIKSMQNLPASGAIGDGSLGDGGFHFSPDPARNKAGFDDRADGTRVYRSYGSATADGLRGLVRCGLPSGDPRVVAARGWLEAHFAADHHPGAFAEGLAQDQEAFYFYWCWSVSHAFNALNVDRIHQQGQEIVWADVLTAELLRRQRTDGTWANAANFMREDDPLLATSLALAALLIDRIHLTAADSVAVPGSAAAPTAGKARPETGPTPQPTTAALGTKAPPRMTWVWLAVGVAVLISVFIPLAGIVRRRGR